jgi:hypothetical protein
MRWRLVLCAVVLAACGPSATPHDAGHRVDAAIPPPDAWFGDTNASDSGACASAPMFAEVQSVVLVPRCAPSDCHSSSSPEPTGGLVLDAPSARAQLVGASSYPGVARVIPGDVTHSLLWRKITNDLPTDGSLGQPMPLPGTAGWISLPASELELIRCWIATGAR